MKIDKIIELVIVNPRMSSSEIYQKLKEQIICKNYLKY
jgi:hypothetical protein